MYIYIYTYAYAYIYIYIYICKYILVALFRMGEIRSCTIHRQFVYKRDTSREAQGTDPRVALGAKGRLL